MSQKENRRILLIDDNESIHQDFKKILLPGNQGTAELDGIRAAFLGVDQEQSRADAGPAYELHSAFQGEEGYETACAACDEGKPFAMAFVDMRMPPGWDGVQTIAKLWERDPDLQVVICTAFSDYTWEETVEKLGRSDRLLILKKPFDAVEISQLAAALTEKWNMAVREKALFAEAKRAEQEARAYAASLETVNRALVTSKAAADMSLELRTDLLVQVSNEVSLRLAEILGSIATLSEVSAQAGMTGEFEKTLEISQHLVQTLDELLDVTSHERGQSSIRAVTCSAHEIVAEVVAEFREDGLKKGIELEIKTDSKIPDSIELEACRVRQILRNLVENAVRNTTTGTVTICLRTGKTEDWQRPRLEIDVSDTGNGIPKEHMGAIFEPFPREKGDGQRSGYGFGLSLARRLAGMLGGDITARSQEGLGSTFTLTLEYGTMPEESAA